MGEIFEDVTSCDHQVIKLRIMKWLVYVEYMEVVRHATWMRIDAVLRLNNTASEESTFLGREERYKKEWQKARNANMKYMALYLGVTVADYIMKTEYDDWS